MGATQRIPQLRSQQLTQVSGAFETESKVRARILVSVPEPVKVNSRVGVRIEQKEEE